VAPDIGQLIQEQQHELRAAEQAKQKSGPRRGPAPLKPMDALSIYKADYPPTVFVVDDLLPLGLTLAAGRPKVGKSWLALQLAISVAFGEPALGRFGVKLPGRVTYLALEEPAERTHRRFKQLVPHADARLQNIQFLYQIQPLMTGGAAQLDAFLAANRSELVVIDTLLAMVAAHSSRKDVLRGDYLEVNTLRQIAEKHMTALLCVAHSRKAAGDLIDTVLGTSGTTAACDSVWSLKRSSSGPNEGSLEVVGRDFGSANYGLQFSNSADGFGWSVTTEGADAEMSEERRDILMLLQQEGAKKPAEIAKLLVKNAVTVRRLIQKLAHDGVIRRQTNGTYIPNEQHERSERVNSVNE
jgi:hypothetical protein